jgi:ArsR family transcriptional regulator, arsenate/arsenite/antimonite-responsive transcriptional repressor
MRYDRSMTMPGTPENCCPPVRFEAPLVPPQRDRLVTAFRALGDPTRLEILRLVSSQPQPICVCDIVVRFDVSQPTISHHLKVLREAGLVTVSRRGVWAYYAADPRGLALLRDSLETLDPVRLEAVG